jgi:uncharacterized protein YyaL (SSP411 family)
LLTATEEYLYPPQLIIVRGTGKQLETWRALAQKVYAPNRCVFCIDNNATDLLEPLARKAPMSTTVAYVCLGHTCLPPIVDMAEFEARLHRHDAARR